ncbi:hypothetical protein GXW78_25575 [Roseomonas terrae]|uniref:Uncharacterized protein n=1 Tax=Neoroseomonas terrae TaxID=424799 RepID=A0ABS5ER01_9PROT|nr:hypothetical protein [Neoroseomonas terrae]MBR0653052.1 hypothetical protein [Neoroseomonas terrae]
MADALDLEPEARFPVFLARQLGRSVARCTLKIEVFDAARLGHDGGTRAGLGALRNSSGLARF